MLRCNVEEERIMALENVIAYAIVLGLPLWLVAEEIFHRFAPRLARRERGAPAVHSAASSPAPTSLEHGSIA
jgi:hypothetical protein